MPAPAADIYANYYIMRSWGGWSPCIEGNNQYGLRPFRGSVLPNCVGYTVGRFNELMREGDCVWLGSTAAKNIFGLAMSQGLQATNDPVVGGVICWSSAGDGHCAVIEEILSPTAVRTSESGWSYEGPDIITDQIRYKENGGWWYRGGYTYQGIVVPPYPVVGDAEDYYMLWLQEETLWK